MRFPNGYGSVIKLKGNRRNPYAVRITVKNREDDENGNAKQIYKYLDYFKTPKEAHIFLASYNSGNAVKEHVALVKQPTFEEVYNDWYKYRHNMNKKPSFATSRSYSYAFGLLEDLHKKKFASLKLSDLQDIVDKYKGYSKGVSGNIKTVLLAMYQYALKHDLVDRDYSVLVDYEYSSERRTVHVDFKIEEIEYLWNNVGVEYVDWVLIMIYMGWRVSEFCDLENKNINIDSRFIIGGGKTEAGKNRTVPIHKKILPLIEKYYNPENQYLLSSKIGSKMTYKTFLLYWTELMTTLNMKHTPHDTRYTTATLLDNAGANKVSIKKIMGHAISDVTDGVYIQKDITELLRAIDLIKI